MNKLMSKFINSSLLGSIGLLILGIMLIYQSEFTIVTISYVIGALIITIGIIAIIKYSKNINEKEKNELDIIYGIVCIILGIIVIGHPQAVASIIPLVVGALIILTSALKINYGLVLKRNKNNLWKSTLAMSIITLICGLLLIFNPFKGAVFITKVVGILILIYAILDIISTVTIKSNVKKIQTAIEEKIIEAEVIEEKEEDEEESENA